MITTKTLDELREQACVCGPKRVAVAVSQEPETLLAVADAQKMGMAEAVLFGDEQQTRRVADEVGVDLSCFELEHNAVVAAAALAAVKSVSSGRADIVMKGAIDTSSFLKAVLNKSVGLRTGGLLSHVGVFEVSGYDRLILMSDGGINIAPTLKQKVDIVNNVVNVAHSLGISVPRVAVLSSVEQVRLDIGSTVTVDAAVLTKMNALGQIEGAVVDGPISLDNALSSASARMKGVQSPVVGRADIFLVHDIEAGNVFGKGLLYFAGARWAAIVAGASAPVVMTSRADSHDDRLLSMALAVVLTGFQGKE